MIGLFRSVLLSISVLVYLFLAAPAAGSELIGILPFSNQRYQKQDDWLGYYIQARIKANLVHYGRWQFHPRHVLALWSQRLDRTLPVSPRTSILITGAFQQVADLGYITARATRLELSGAVSTRFERHYQRGQLVEEIDHLARELGHWIQSDFKMNERIDFPSPDVQDMKEICLLRQQLFEPAAPLDIGIVLRIEDRVSVNSPAEVIGDLAEAMLILSMRGTEQERKRIFQKTEALLRKAILKHPSHARLYELLAEVYYLSNNYASWVEKTASDAVKLDPQSSLGYILKIVVNETDPDTKAADLTTLARINPWLFTDTVNAGAHFQKGLLKPELLQLKIPKNESG